MDVASDNEVQNNQSDQEDNNSLIIQSDNEESHNIQSSYSPEQQSNGNSESEHDSDGDCHKKQNDEISDNEIEERENCEIESCDEVNSDDEPNVQSEGEQEGASDRELEPEASATPLPSDNEVHHSDDDAEHSDNEVHRSDEEVQHSDNEGQHSDNEVQRSDEEVQHSDEEVHHSDVDIQQSDEDVEAQHSDEAEMPHSDEEQEHSYHSDDEVHRSDEEVHRSDDEQSFPPSPAESIEEKAEASDDENMKNNIAENILAVTDNEDSDVDIDSDSGESKVGELIADIFGESDEDEEFEGFGEEDLAAAKEKKEKKKATVLSDSEEDEEGDLTILEEQKPPEVITIEEGDADDKRKDVLPVISDEEDSDAEMNSRMPCNFVYDFEVMMEKKKESRRKRKRNDIDLINDSDDLIGEIIAQMKEVAEEDRQLNKNKCAATKKLKLLPMVTSQLRKHDLKETFLDKGILNVMTDWLSPLPDRSLPHLQIRDAMFRLLQQFPPIDQVLLKSSNIGRAVMYLYKHPKETKENRERAGKLISEWARPIFNLTTNFHSMSKEEREQRDFEHMPKKRKLRLETGEAAMMKQQDIDKALVGEDKALRPGEKGWIARARVPMPSMRDYVVRPKWNTEADFSRGSSRKPTTRLDKHIRNLMEKKKLSKVQRAVTISIEGRKMAL